MARIKINDLPKDMKISKEEMKKVIGGALFTDTVSADLNVNLYQTSTGQITDKSLNSCATTITDQKKSTTSTGLPVSIGSNVIMSSGI